MVWHIKGPSSATSRKNGNSAVGWNYRGLVMSRSRKGGELIDRPAWPPQKNKPALWGRKTKTQGPGFFAVVRKGTWGCLTPTADRGRKDE